MANPETNPETNPNKNMLNKLCSNLLELVEKYPDKNWDYEALSRNPNIPIDILIKKGWTSDLITNPNLTFNQLNSCKSIVSIGYENFKFLYNPLTRKILQLKPLSMPGAHMGSWPDKGLIDNFKQYEDIFKSQNQMDIGGYILAMDPYQFLHFDILIEYNLDQCNSDLSENIKHKFIIYLYFVLMKI